MLSSRDSLYPCSEAQVVSSCIFCFVVIINPIYKSGVFKITPDFDTLIIASVVRHPGHEEEEGGRIIRWSSAFLPESFERLVLSGRSSDLSRFWKPSHLCLFNGSRQWQVFQNHDRFYDRASQQRVLLRIYTVFPFHCNCLNRLQHHDNTNINFSVREECLRRLIDMRLY